MQEALTNVIKHARALRTEVRLRYGAEELELSVIDDGAGAGGGDAPATASSACASASRCSAARSRPAGAATGRGYAVRAVLPL